MNINDILVRYGKVCFVAGDPETALQLVQAADVLVRKGLEAHLLWCGTFADRPALTEIVVHHLEDSPLPRPYLAPNGTPGCDAAVYQSNLVRYGVEALHRKHRFDAVVFSTWRATGFRCIQAKRAAMAFHDVRLIALLDSTNQWRRETQRRWCSPNDHFLDYCERYAFENADGQWIASPHLADYVRGLGWNVHPSASIGAFAAGWMGEHQPAVARVEEAPAKVSPEPAVTVAVSHYNLGRFLPETLASLAAQTCTDMEALVIDDGSTCADSLRVFEEQRKVYPHFRFIHQSNVGLGAARNAALSEAKAEFFIPVDADNIAAPDMVEKFVRGMRSCPDLSALTSFFAVFENNSDISEGNFLYQYCPTGGPHLAACAFNVYGDANAIFRTEDLRSVGGFVADRETYCHDWETFVKLIHSGRHIGVIPEYLFYYRRRTDSMSSMMTANGANTYPFIQRMITSFAEANGGAANPETRMMWEATANYFLAKEANQPAPPPGMGRRLFRGAVKRLAAAGRSAWKVACSQGRRG